jgi:hypothetical protein
MSDDNENPKPSFSEILNHELYPDLIQLGGLASAMADTARRLSIDLGNIRVHSSAGRFNSATVDSGRGTISILLGAEKRLFGVDIYSGKGYPWASGSTDDLAAVVKVADAWRNGATLSELNTQFPFMKYSAMAQAYESGDPVATMWGLLLDDRDLEPIRPLLRAVRSDSRLGWLFPSVSHSTLLRLAKNYADRSEGEIWITQQADGTYRVESPGRSGSQRQVESAEAAVATATSYLD